MLRQILAIFLLCALLLTGCTTVYTDAASSVLPYNTASSRPAAESETPPADEGDKPDAAIAGGASAGSSAAGTPVTSEDEVRAIYDGTDMTIYSITPYNGDFLVRYTPAPDNGPWWLDWIYGQNGTRVKLMFCDQGIRECEIQAAGSIRVLTDGQNSEWAYRSFPHIQYATAILNLDENGAPVFDEDLYYYSSPETYWADITEPVSMGMAGRRETIIDMSMTVAGVDIAFGPPVDLEGFGSFYADVCTPPAAEFSYDADSRVLSVIFRDTSLSSGDVPVLDDEFLRNHYAKQLEETGVTFPTGFPSGPLEGSNPLIVSADVEESDADTLLKLVLTEDAAAYTVESGYTGPDDNGPYLRLILRERGSW